MRKKILSMSIAAVMTAFTSSGVMAFDTDGCSTCSNDGPILVQNEADMAAGYQGNNLPEINGTPADKQNPHPPVQSFTNLKLSSNGLGDALIFPMFKQEDGWGTEIVVRNTDQDHAIVAKVAVYAADDSEEVLDFNVYLSATDVARFKIENGKVTSEDGSILRVFPAPSSNSNDVTRDKFASKARPFSRDLSATTGYVVVYGMAQASTDQDSIDDQDMRYHKQHPRLFKNYRRELDKCRPGWRNGHQNAMVNGTYTRHTLASPSVENYSVAAPNQANNCNLVVNADAFDAINRVVDSATQASVLASKITDKATALQASLQVSVMLTEVNALGNILGDIDSKVTQVQKLLEVSKTAIDKAIEVINPNDQATPEQLAKIASTINDIAQEVATAATSASSSATPSAPGNFFGDVDPSLTGTVRLYNATNGARDMILPATAIENFTSGNKIIYTEGEIASLQDRRIVDGSNGWAKYFEHGIRTDAKAFTVRQAVYNFAADSLANQLVITQPYKRVLVQLGNDDGYWQDTDKDFGGFSFLYNVFDENEHIDNISYTESPHNSGRKILPNELEIMANLEEGTEFDGKDGFAMLRFTDINGNDSGLPAIITQMIGTTVGGVPQVNWVYSQTK